MNVQQLIDELQEVQNKNLEVYMYYNGSKDLDKNGQWATVQFVDDDFGNQVDIYCTD